MTNNLKGIGILDPDGKHPNPLTNLPYDDKYRSYSKLWSAYPAYENASKYIDLILINQVIIVISGTGSGKTVLFPKYALHATNYQGHIAITLPKQIITKSSAEFAAETLNVEIGKQVGYKYKGSPPNGYSNQTQLLYATDGTIVSMLLKDPLLKDFDMVIIDEAHERKVQIDFLLYLLKSTLKSRPEFKVIIMSATIDQTIFDSYFSSFKCATINIGAKTNHPIESVYSTEKMDKSKYMQRGMDIIQKNTKPGDIIFFVPTVADAKNVCRTVETNSSLSTIYCTEVYSGMDNTKRDIAISKDSFKTNKLTRKLILATGVAESSITFEGITIVIDSGYELFSHYDPNIDSRVLEKSPITQAQVLQRKGRAGRTEPGICYHLYTEAEFNSFKKFPLPSIRTCNITAECLRLIAVPTILNVENLLRTLSEFIEPPREQYTTAGIKQLKKLGLVTNEITDIGKYVNDLAFDPILGLTVYYAYQYACKREVLAIVAMLESCKGNIDNIFVPAFTDEQKKKVAKAKSSFDDKHGDHIAIYKIMKGALAMIKSQPKIENIVQDLNSIDSNSIDTELESALESESDSISISELHAYAKKHMLQYKVLDQAVRNYNIFKSTADRILRKNIAILPDIPENVYHRVLLAFSKSHELHKGYKSQDSYNTSSGASNVRISRSSWIQSTSVSKSKSSKSKSKSNSNYSVIFYHELFNNDGRLQLNVVSEFVTK